jgi:eukaryotic-like serine/threonine-protein kinase
MSLRRRQRLGKYRIECRLSDSDFATVYRAHDTIEGIDVALKLPHAALVDRATLAAFRKEARTAARLDHTNILTIKTAEEIDGHFVIVTPLGIEDLGTRMQRRMSATTALDLAEQLLRGLAEAHDQKVIHLDVKPQNAILFPRGRLRLADFGIARVALRTLVGSGSGTVGYIAPEQALGQPSMRSDVFSAGLVIWQLMTKQLPKWPFDWPHPGLARARREFGDELAAVCRRATEVREHRRFADAGRMLTAFERARKRSGL